MSRLDDELKLMFQREEPSAGFAERVLAQINAQAQPQQNRWQRLVRFFQLPTMRWAVAATAILLIAIIGFVQYQRLHKNATDRPFASGEQTTSAESVVAKGQTTQTDNENEVGIKKSEGGKTTGSIEQQGITKVNNPNFKQRRSQKLQYVKESSPNQEETRTTQRKSEGEIAKEQLMKALFIASATVNEAKKLAIGDD